MREGRVWYSRIRENRFVEIAEAETFAVKFDVERFRAAGEKLGFDFGCVCEDAANDLWRMNDVSLRRSCRFGFPGAVGGFHVFAETEKNGMA